MSSFAGRWFTTFGPMTLRQDDSRVSGSYGAAAAIRGSVAQGRYSFEYEEPGERGTGWFELVRFGRFIGEYVPEGSSEARTWEGNREFDGLWEGSFGRLRLVQETDHVRGSYVTAGPAAIEGTLEEGKLTFSYSEPDGKGSGWFEIDDDLAGLRGEWRTDDENTSGEWSARRVLPVQGCRWLVVVEAQWQRSLGDREYSFGDMLRAFFAPLSTVRVRHRYFQDEASLLHWCCDAQYLAEPVILVVASHGVAEGLRVQGGTIDTQRIVDELRTADNLALLHFSCCLVGKDERRALSAAPFPASGYTTSVNWAQSALLEFIYLDLILRKGFAPALAAEHLGRLVSFAGNDAGSESPYPGAGFRFFDGARTEPTA